MMPSRFRCFQCPSRSSAVKTSWPYAGKTVLQMQVVLLAVATPTTRLASAAKVRAASDHLRQTQLITAAVGHCRSVAASSASSQSHLSEPRIATRTSSPRPQTACSLRNSESEGQDKLASTPSSLPSSTNQMFNSPQNAARLISCVGR